MLVSKMRPGGMKMTSWRLLEALGRLLEECLELPKENLDFSGQGGGVGATRRRALANLLPLGFSSI